MSAPAEISRLVQRYREHREQYISSGYKEAELRREFLDKMFKALGWDVDNESDYDEQYKEVVHEKSLDVEGDTRAPDYSFRIGGTTKFFIEAKKPSVDITVDKKPAFQLKRYAWSAKLPLSILTNFEDTYVYDCRYKPDKNDAPDKSRVMYISWDELEARWDELCAVFTKEAIMKGSFDKYARDKKRGTSEVDDAILEDIEGWRDELARNIAIRNPDLTIEEMNFAVQRIIDRILFLRICEDRGMEPEGQLYKVLDKREDIYRNLFDLFQLADDKYNSGLFHFTQDRKRTTKPDTVTPGLAIDDKVVGNIILSLYYPYSPYQFDVMPADILGQVYEQFLGKVIRLTAGHHAKVEEKPEVKKAGGVYYTPTYIVEYIVNNTVVKLCEGKSPDEMKKLKILDPACGSGSFLIVAYQRLMDKHLEWYSANSPKKHKECVFQNDKGAWQLTLQEKKRILLSSIYGVDLDAQAVEVTKLNLLLKALEGESRESVENVNRLFKEPALPDLASNIKCGNSLIDFDIMKMLDGLDQGKIDEHMNRINPFSWEDGFPTIMNAGGFDVVIGNPPYVRPHNLTQDVKEYYWKHYSTFVKKSDLYCCFIERAILVLKQGGMFGYIVSNGWLRLDSFEQLRSLLLDKVMLKRIIDFTDNVFAHVHVRTAILLFIKGKSNPNHAVEVATTEVIPELSNLPLKLIKQISFKDAYKIIFDLSLDEYQENIKRKMRETSINLGQTFNLSFGLKTGDDSKFLTHSPKSSKYKPLLRGANVHRYSSSFDNEYVWYVPLEMRKHRVTARPGTAARFEQPKVLIRDTGDGLQGTFDDENYYVKDVLVVSLKDKDKRKLMFLTGVLNSTLMRYYYETSFPTLHVQRNELGSLPIRTIDFSNKEDVARHDKMVELVERMLKLHKDVKEARTPDAETRIQRQIEATDKEIDGLVYELYGLTADEIKIVEGK